MADSESTKAKRRVKNPETFRERAIKATDESDKPKRSARFRSASGKVVRPVTSPVGRAAGKVYRFKPLRPVIVVLRFLGKILLPSYFRNSWKELRQVTWPTRTQSRQLTFAVLVFAVVFGAVIAVVDYGLDKVFRDVLLK